MQTKFTQIKEKLEVRVLMAVGGTMKSRLVVLGAAVLALAATPAASAAPPANDDFDNATIIAALPFTDSVDVREATAADDPATFCSFGAAIFTIWYAYTPPTNMRLNMNTLQSPGVSSSGVSVYTGSRGNLTEVNCTTSGGGLHAFDVTGGTTYYFMVWSSDAAVVMQFDLSELLPPPSIDLDINPGGTVNPKTGVATISGTVTCSRSVVLPSMSVALSQLFARRVRIEASGPDLVDVPCTSSGSPWSGVVEGFNGRLAPGSATAFASTGFCNEEACTFDQVTKSIRLRGEG